MEIAERMGETDGYSGGRKKGGRWLMKMEGMEEDDDGEGLWVIKLKVTRC